MDFSGGHRPLYAEPAAMGGDVQRRAAVRGLSQRMGALHGASGLSIH